MISTRFDCDENRGYNFHFRMDVCFIWIFQNSGTTRRRVSSTQSSWPILSKPYTIKPTFTEIQIRFQNITQNLKSFVDLFEKLNSTLVASWLNLQRLWYTNHTSRCIESDVHKVLFETTRYFENSDLDRLYFSLIRTVWIYFQYIPKLKKQFHRTSISRLPMKFWF